MAGYEGKAGLVTGAGSGIGRATAMAFADQGAQVVVADLNAAGGEETVRMIEDVGGQALFVQADVSKAGDVEAMIKRTVGAYGRLDFAFNNAGIEGTTLVRTADYTEEAWDRVINVNLKGVWLCMKHEIAQMVLQGGGAIVNTSSVAGLQGSRLAGAAYGASKHGVIGLTKTAALEYAQEGIRVNAVCPGIIETPMLERGFRGDSEVEARFAVAQPIGRVGTAEEVAQAVVWLCSDDASLVTGLAMAVDGGMVA